jgi:hypothetical protein
VIPNPWVILGFVVALIGASLGGYFYGKHHEGLIWQAKVSAQEAEAATLLDQLDKTAALKDAQQAEAGRNMEAEHAKHLADLDATSADFARRLAERVRDAERGARGSCAVPPTAPAAGEPKSASSGGDDGRGPIDTVAVSRARDALKKLQEDVQFCWHYVGTITR